MNEVQLFPPTQVLSQFSQFWPALPKTLRKKATLSNGDRSFEQKASIGMPSHAELTEHHTVLCMSAAAFAASGSTAPYTGAFAAVPESPAAHHTDQASDEALQSMAPCVVCEVECAASRGFWLSGDHRRARLEAQEWDTVPSADSGATI